MASPSRLPRVQDEPAFVLHRYDWSESSLILEVFSRRHGRLPLVAKGVKRPTSQYRSVLLAFQPLLLSWGGDAEVRTLKAAHWQGGHVMPGGDALLASYYLNELLLKLVTRDDPHPVLFDGYAKAVARLARAPEGAAALLRAFELLLLREIGMLPDLTVDGVRLLPLLPASRYRLTADSGLLPCRHDEAVGSTGEQWLALGEALCDAQPLDRLAACCQRDQGALRAQLRDLLHYHSGVQVFQTRQLMVDAQRLAAAHQPLALS